jgi:hypothetical protein
MQSGRYYCQIGIKFEFCRLIFVKTSSIEFHENSSSESQVISRGQTNAQTDRQTDKYDESNSSFLQFRKIANKRKIVCTIHQQMQ